MSVFISSAAFSPLYTFTFKSFHPASSTFHVSSHVLGMEGYKKWKTRHFTPGNLSDRAHLGGHTQTRF